MSSGLYRFVHSRRAVFAAVATIDVCGAIFDEPRNCERRHEFVNAQCIFTTCNGGAHVRAHVCLAGMGAINFGHTTGLPCCGFYCRLACPKQIAIGKVNMAGKHPKYASTANLAKARPKCQRMISWSLMFSSQFLPCPIT